MVEETIVDDAFIKSMAIHREPVDKSKGILFNCSKNVALFSELMLGIRLRSWQVAFLKDLQDAVDGKTTRREFVAITSRQIGKSTALAVFSLWAAVFNKYPGGIGNCTMIGIASASDRQARVLLNEIRRMYRLGDLHMSKRFLNSDNTSMYPIDSEGRGFFSHLMDDKAANNTTTVSLRAYNESLHQIVLDGSKSGSLIESYAPTASVLGKTFTVVIIDEAGKTDAITDEFFYDFMYPTGNAFDAIRVYTSTPWVSSGFFYRMVDPDAIYGLSPAKVWLFTCDAVRIEDPEYHKTILRTIDQMNTDGKIDEVQRAYYCRFIKGQKSYFNPERVQEAFKPYGMTEAFTQECDMGIDFGGQVTSRTVVTISYMMDDGTVRRLYHKAYPVGKDLALLDDVAILLKAFNVQRIIPDDCPAGDYLIRLMREKGWNVQPMKFVTDKVKKYGSFRDLLNKGKVESYEDDELKVEMLAMEFRQGVRNTIIEHAPGYTDDLIDSFVMSCYFFLQESTGVKTYDW